MGVPSKETGLKSVDSTYCVQRNILMDQKTTSKRAQQNKKRSKVRQINYGGIAWRLEMTRRGWCCLAASVHSRAQALLRRERQNQLNAAWQTFNLENQLSVGPEDSAYNRVSPYSGAVLCWPLVLLGCLLHMLLEDLSHTFWLSCFTCC